MSPSAGIQLILLLAILLALTKPLGLYIAHIFMGKPVGLNQVLRPVENGLYRLCGIHAEQEMSWKQYLISLLLFNLLGVFILYLLQRVQVWLPLNPQHFSNIKPDSAFNTAISFVTNTDWQNYAGENTMSYFTQMLGLTVQNFFSAATGISVAMALIRGFARHNAQTIGNFWVDMTRAILYVLLPLSLIFAIFLMSQGVIQNFLPYQEAQTLNHTTQILPMGPVASQEAIKILGSNGGGFFNANSAHPFENPTPLSNFLQMLALVLIPAALCYTFGYLVGDTRQGWTLLTAMIVIFVVLAVFVLYAEQHGNPLLTPLSVNQGMNALQSGGNMEGKEVRFGPIGSSLFATVSTASSGGSMNSVYDSFTPLGGLVPMWLMQLGEVIFGGVGSGLYGILIFAILAVFISGLLIGRTPELLGKKIEAFEMKMVSIAILIIPFLVLLGSALSVMTIHGRAGIFNPGPHGFSEILYAFSSAANNNGSAFAGLSANTPFYNLLLGLAMWFGRFWTMVPILALAGSLVMKKRLAVTSGTLPTYGMLFVVLLIGTIVLVGALTYLPALALGPIVEHLMVGLN